jgi:hypothetical protein
MRTIIAGGRDFADYELLKDKCDYYLGSQAEVEIVSGRCHKGVLTFVADDGIKVYGADGLGERYAKERGLSVKYFPADWRLGKIAGPLRNARMAFYADALIAFHDGVSRGTNDMISKATEKGLKVKTVIYAKD